MNNAHLNGGSPQTEAVASLIQTHVKRYPLLAVTDVYRLLHQAVFGAGGRIPNRKTAREWLDHESGLVTPDASGPLLETVHPSGEIVRLYLSAYRAANGNLSALLDACIRTSEVLPGDAQQMAAWWGIFAGLVAPPGALALHFEPRVVALTGRIRAAESWAVLAHSPVYLEHYRPFYRLLTRSEAEGLLQQQGITPHLI